MELIKAISDRRSIRRFKKDSIPDDLIIKILEAARMAPSGGNFQPWRFVIIKNNSCKSELKEFIPQTFVTQAPLIIVVCIDTSAISQEYQSARAEELIQARSFFVPLNKNKISNNHLPDFDLSFLHLNAAIAVEHMNLRAVDLELGMCWVMNFNRKKIKEILSLDDRHEPFVLLPTGFPAQKPKPRPRFALEDIIIKEIY